MKETSSTFYSHLVTCILVCCVSGCSTLGSAPVSNVAEQLATPVTIDEVEALKTPLPPQLLSDLFLADVMAQRENHGEAARIKIAIARDFQLVQFAEEAVWHQQQANESVEELLNRWATWDSTSDAYLASRARYEISRSNYGETLRYASQIGATEIANPFFQSVGANAMRWPEQNQERLLEVLAALRESRPELSGVRSAIALTLFYRQPERALQELAATRKQFPQDEAVVATYAGLLAEAGRFDMAVSELDEFLVDHDSLDIETQRLKTRFYQLDTEPDFLPLFDHHDANLNWALETSQWLVSFQFFDQAEALRLRLAANPQFTARAQLLQATIYEARGNLDLAVDQLMAIKQQDIAIIAAPELNQLAFNASRDGELALWYDTQRLNDPQQTERWSAIELDGICRFSSLDACYVRATELLKRWPSSYVALQVISSYLTEIEDHLELETQLEQFLDSNPDAAIIRNNLAYSWLNRNVRLSEAEEQIRLALAAEPDNPAYIDSLGWVLHLRGNSEEAYQLVARASEYMEHPDIYRHLVIILRSLGKPDSARQIIERARAAFPDTSWDNL